MRLVSLHKNYKSYIVKAAKGNRRAQQQIFELFAPKMLSVCRQYVKNNEVAEEVMLNGFLKVFTYLSSYKDEGSFEGWVRRIMINEAITQLRKDKNIIFEDEKQLEYSLELSQLPETKLEVEDLQKLIDQLPDGYKAVFILYAIEGYKHSEIAELLAISESTSKSQLFKARKWLQQQLHKNEIKSYGNQ